MDAAEDIALPEFGLTLAPQRNDVLTRLSALLDEVRRVSLPEAERRHVRALLGLLVQYELATMSEVSAERVVGAGDQLVEGIALSLAWPAEWRATIAALVRHIRLYLLRRELVQQYLLSPQAVPSPNGIVPLPLAELITPWRRSFAKLRRLGVLAAQLPFSSAVAGLRGGGQLGLVYQLLETERLRERHAGLERAVLAALSAAGPDLEHGAPLPAQARSLIEQLRRSLALALQRGIRLPYETVEEFVFARSSAADPGAVLGALEEPTPLPANATATDGPTAEAPATGGLHSRPRHNWVRRLPWLIPATSLPLAAAGLLLVGPWSGSDTAALAAEPIASPTVGLAAPPPVPTDPTAFQTDPGQPRPTAARVGASEAQPAPLARGATSGAASPFPLAGTVKVASGNLYLCRTAPLPRSRCPADQQATIASGSALTVLAQNDEGWFQVRRADGSTWWAFAYYVRPKNGAPGVWQALSGASATVYADADLRDPSQQPRLERDLPLVSRPLSPSSSVHEVMQPTGRRGYVRLAASRADSGAKVRDPRKATRQR